MKKTEELYNQIKNMSYEQFSVLFLSADTYLKNNNFDWTSLIYRGARKKEKEKQLIKNLTDMNMDLFSSKNLEMVSEDKNLNDIETLQKLFFFLLKNIADQAGNSEIIKFCEDAQKNNSWKTVKTQTEILNSLIKNTGAFEKFVPVEEKVIDFSTHKDGLFSAKTAIIKLLYYFSGNITKEDIINELNYIREQQKRILPCIPCWSKKYTESEANQELSKYKKNIKFLRDLDSGFKVKGFSQTLFKENKDLQISFNRTLECKIFRETDNDWTTPLSYDSKKSKIVGEKSERSGNRNALYKKYLYPERNVFTHSGENFAVQGLFNTRPRNLDEWRSITLYAFFDVRNCLRKNSGQQITDRILNMLDFYFKKIVSDVKFLSKPKNDEDVWDAVFDEKGMLKLTKKQLKEVNIYQSLNEIEIEQLKGLFRFMYCSSHEDEDFIEKNKLTIVLYLMVVSLKINQYM